MIESLLERSYEVITVDGAKLVLKNFTLEKNATLPRGEAVMIVAGMGNSCDLYKLNGVKSLNKYLAELRYDGQLLYTILV